MDPGVFAVVSSSLVQQRRLEILANNLANLNTVGFKSDTPIFQVGSVSELKGGEGVNNTVVEQTSWVDSATDFSQGPMTRTNNPNDVALNGHGFFVLQTPAGVRYTRSGQFTTDSQGELVSKDGFQVLGKGGVPIRIEPSRIGRAGMVINSEGEVRVEGQLLGQIDVVDFPRPYRLEKRGNSLFEAITPDQETIPVPNTVFVQGSLEGANVGAIEQMVALIEVARLYESYQKILQSFDDMDNRAVNDLGRVGGAG